MTAIRMHALRWHAAADVRYEQVDPPAPPGPHEVLLEVLACGICGTDLEEWRHGPINIPVFAHPLSGRQAPITLGHEVVGRAITVGLGSIFGVGDILAIGVNSSCGHCAACLSGDTQLCPYLSSKGLHDDGGLADFMAAPDAMCRRVRPETPVTVAALSEPLAVAVRAVRRGEVGAGTRVVVVGGGTVGQLISRVAMVAGAVVVVVEPVKSRRVTAIAAGCAGAVAPIEAASVVHVTFDGAGADVTFESAGSSAAFGTATQVTRPGGRIVLVGTSAEPLPTSALQLVHAEWTVTSSLSHTMADFNNAVDLLEDGRVDVSDLVSDIVPLSRAVDLGFEALVSEPDYHRKVLIVPDRVSGEVRGASVAGADNRESAP